MSHEFKLRLQLNFIFNQVSEGEDLTLSAYMDVNGNGLRDSWEPVTTPLKTSSFSVSNLQQIKKNLTLVDPDNDQDGLPAYKEILVYETSDNNPDSDNDGINDGEEVSAGTNPKDNTSPGATLLGQVTY